MKKVVVKQVVEQEQAKSCSTCQHCLKGRDKWLCSKRLILVTENSHCGLYEAGAPLLALTPEVKLELVKEFIRRDVELKALQEQLSMFKEFLMDITEDKEIIGNYKIVNKELEKTYIDTQKARELIKQQPNPDSYFRKVVQKMFRVLDLER